MQEAMQSHQEESELGDELTKARHPLLGRSDSVETAQELGKIIARGGDLMSLMEVAQPAESRPSHCPGIEHVRKAAFDMLTSFAQELLAMLALHRALRTKEPSPLCSLQLVQPPFAPVRIANQRLDR